MQAKRYSKKRVMGLILNMPPCVLQSHFSEHHTNNVCAEMTVSWHHSTDKWQDFTLMWNVVICAGVKQVSISHVRRHFLLAHSGPSWVWWWISIHNKRRLVWQITAKLSWWLNLVYCSRRPAAFRAESGDKRWTQPDGIWEMSTINAVMQMTCLQYKSCVQYFLPSGLDDSIYWTTCHFSLF